jgi:hypothetical protein
VCCAAIAFELVRSVPHVMMQLENIPLMEDYMPRIMEASAPQGAGGEQVASMMTMFMRLSMIIGWVIFVGWLMLKLAFYAVTCYYLALPKIKSLYAKA